jgi:hypothetical protein
MSLVNSTSEDAALILHIEMLSSSKM